MSDIVPEESECLQFFCGSLILKGYGKWSRVVTGGYGLGGFDVFRREVLKFISKFTKTMRFISERTREIDGS